MMGRGFSQSCYPLNRFSSEEELAAYYKSLIAQYEAYYQQIIAQYQQALLQAGFTPKPMTEEEIKKYNEQARTANLKYLKDTLNKLKEYEKSVEDQISKLETEGKDLEEIKKSKK
jgi:hypothetical protein